MRHVTRGGGAAAGLAAALLLAACATPPGGDADPADPVAVDGEVVGPRHPVLVLDDGDGPELCLGVVATSLPPQCGGPALVGWDWDDWQGHYQDMAGTRWGDFHVVGVYDPDAGTFTPVEVTPGSEFERKDTPAEPFSFASPCPEPAGGWRVLDPATTTQQTLDAALARAARLDGYAGAWIDQSVNPAFGAERDWTQEPEVATNDAQLMILNVRVTGETADAEAALREVWGGMLCISAAAHTEAELRSIQDALVSEVDGMLMAGVDVVAGRVDIDIVFDDGTLQARLDAEHGPGVVRVTSALQPAAS